MSSSPKFRTEPLPSVRLFNATAWAAAGAALLCYVATLALLIMTGPVSRQTRWATALLILSATITTVIASAQRLPGLKVLTAAGIIAVLGGIVHGAGATTSIPFGPFVYGDHSGPKFFHRLSWAAPLLWVVLVFTARGVARLILKPWRKLKTHGFWVIGLSTGLIVLLNLALDPFATRVSQYWFWQPTKFPFTWHGMPLTNCLGWALTTLLLLAFTTPLLLNRDSRARKLPPDYQPLVTWNLLLIWFGFGAGMAHLWSAVGVCAGAALLTSFFAIRGARW